MLNFYFPGVKSRVSLCIRCAPANHFETLVPPGGCWDTVHSRCLVDDGGLCVIYASSQLKYHQRLYFETLLNFLYIDHLSNATNVLLGNNTYFNSCIVQVYCPQFHFRILPKSSSNVTFDKA